MKHFLTKKYIALLLLLACMLAIFLSQYTPKHQLHLAVVNFHATWGDKEANLTKMKEMITIAGQKGIQLLVFPELALTGYTDQVKNESGTSLGFKEREEKMHLRLAETIPSTDPKASTNALLTLCKRYSMYVVYGLPEQDVHNPSHYYNSVVVLGPEGIVGTYRKIHPTGTESNWCKEGESPFIFDSPWGPIGINICYDTYAYPELTNYYASKGCKLVLNPTASQKGFDAETGERDKWAWYYMNRLKALTYANDLYIASSNLTGIEKSPIEGMIPTAAFPGGSVILGPSTTYGQHINDETLLASAYTSQEGIYEAILDLRLVHPQKAKALSKPHLYEDWYTQLSTIGKPEGSAQKPHLAVVNFQGRAFDKPYNLEAIATYIEKAASLNVDLILFPELALLGTTLSEEETLTLRLEEEAEVIPGPSTLAIAKLCESYGLYAAFGLLEKSETLPDTYYSSIVLITPLGEIHTYRRTHLDAATKNYLAEGVLPLVLETPFGKVGVSTFGDTQKSHELIRYYVGMGCQIVLNPSGTVPLTSEEINYLEYITDLNEIYLLHASLLQDDALALSSSSFILGPKYGSSERPLHITQQDYYIDYYGKKTVARPVLPTEVANSYNTSPGLYFEQVNLSKALFGSLYDTPLRSISNYASWYHALSPSP